MDSFIPSSPDRSPTAAKATGREHPFSPNLAQAAPSEQTGANDAARAAAAGPEPILNSGGAGAGGTVGADFEPETPAPGLPHSKGFWEWFWQFWLVVTGITVFGLGGGAVWSLVRIPQVRDCTRLVQPFASASLKLYCAQVAAGEQTHEDLLRAIDLVDDLPKDHPLRESADRYIQQWAFDLILLAETQYNEGNLAAALATLEDIPLDRLPCEENNCPRDELLSWEQTWRDTWKQAEAIYKKAEKALLDQDWDLAAATATELLSINNQHWQVTKYNELNNQIREVRDTNSAIARAKALAEKGGVTNLLAAIKLAQTVEPGSNLYSVAQAQVLQFSRQILDVAEEVLERDRDLSGALEIADKVPPIANLQREVQDFKLLAKSQAKSWSGEIPDLEAAIAQAKEIQADRPLYVQSRRLIQGWQKEIQDVAHLNKARVLAQQGNISSLMTAIAEVSLIPKNNPRREEADALVGQWTRRIQTLEDQPYLDRAVELARGGTIAAYQAAISEVSKIEGNRALYSEAQSQMGEWEWEIQRLEDEPYLNEAEQYADSGSYVQAISLAQRISPGRALYDEAQTQIAEWQVQLQAENSLQQARGLSSSAVNNPESLSAAIRTADRVPAQAPQRTQADEAIEQWSDQLLQLALERSGYDLVGAIEVAEQVPPGTLAYEDAQAYIRTWRSQLGL